MTVAVNDAVDEFIAVGGETQFSYTFPIIIPILPTLHPITVENRLSGVLTTLVEGVDFSVTGAGQPLGGTIVLDLGVFPSGAIAGVTWTLERNNPIDRLVDFQVAGDFFAVEVNDDMDYLTQILQDQKRDIDLNFTNSIHLAVGSLFNLGEMDDPIIGNFLRAKAGGGFDWAALIPAGTAVSMDETDTDPTKDKLPSNLLGLQWERARKQSFGVVRMIATTQSDLFDSIPAVWIVYKEDGSELDTTGTTTQGLQEAIDYAVNNGFDLEILGGGLKPIIPNGPHGGALGTNPFATINTSNVVTVSHTAHGLTTNDGVRFDGLGGAVNGIPQAEFDVYRKITFVNVNSYTITMVTNATSTGTGGGSTVRFQHKGINVAVIQCTTTVNWPPMQNKSIVLQSVTISSGSGPTGSYAHVFDSCMMVNFQSIGGQFVVQDSTFDGVIKFAATNELPHDIDGPIITASQFNFGSIANGSTVGAGILFDPTNGAIIGNFFEATEIAATGVGTRGLDIIGNATRTIQRNIFKFADIHDFATTCVRIGTSATGAANIRANQFVLCCNPKDAGKGLEIWGRDNNIDLMISDDDDAADNWILLETSARFNNIRLAGGRALSFTPDITDNSVLRDNSIVTAGRIAASIHLNGSNQVGIATGTTWVKVLFDTQRYDMGGAWHDTNDRWEPVFIGVATISAAVKWVTTVAASRLGLAIFKNGVELHSVHSITHDTSDLYGPTIYVDVEILTATDFFEIFVTQETGSNKDIDGDPNETWVTMTRLF